MLVTGILIPVLSLVVIFLFGVGKFSKQINQAAGERFKRVLTTLTKTPLRGAALGAGFTALTQSSTATTLILVGLADAGLISVFHSLGVIIGANVGATVTSQLVALKAANFAPFFILLGFLVSQFGGSYKRWGKPIFYFGLIFFSLSLISLYIEPVKSDPYIISLFAHLDSVWSALLAGLLFTTVIQSSSVTSGLVVLLVSGGLLSVSQAVPVILGANIGTTATTLLASLGLGAKAKKVAVAHFFFNLLGVAAFVPFLSRFTEFVVSLGGAPQ